MDIKTLDFKIKGDELGYLIALESDKNTPFPFKRVYYIFDIDVQDVRGKHAHKKLEQVLICVKGKCKVLFDDKKSKQVIELDRPDKGVVIPPMVWHEMFDFSPGCLLIALASEFYEEGDYIRNYDEFLKFTP